jgi:hypothetical protein
MSREVPNNEGWQGLSRGGSHGLFVVIMCLSWWVTHVQAESDLKVFESSMENVMWVLKRVTESVSSSSKSGGKGGKVGKGVTERKHAVEVAMVERSAKKICRL